MLPSETAEPVRLPAPVSLTLEEALQVAGGYALTYVPAKFDWTVLGQPWPDLRQISKFTAPELTVNTGSLATHGG
jgi:hypothetical protein